MSLNHMEIPFVAGLSVTDSCSTSDSECYERPRSGRLRLRWNGLGWSGVDIVDRAVIELGRLSVDHPATTNDLVSMGRRQGALQSNRACGWGEETGLV